MWANSVDDLPVKPKPIIYLDISDEPVKVKAESDVNAKSEFTPQRLLGSSANRDLAHDPARLISHTAVDLLVYFEYR